jgi:hypothetical protein
MRGRGSGSRDRLRTMQAEEPGCRSGAEENSVCAWEARERIKAGARISLGSSWRAEVSMRGLGLSSSDMPVMIGALRAPGADAGVENGRLAPNQALLLTRKTNDGVAGCGAWRGDAYGRGDLGHRAAERQPLAHVGPVPWV